MSSKRSRPLKNKDFVSTKKQEGDHVAMPSFEKAKALFPLDKRVETVSKTLTERAWKTYIVNRVTAENKFRGHEEEEEDPEVEYEFGDIQALKLIRDNMARLEKDMELNEGTLSKSFRLLACSDARFDDDQPTTVNTLTRVYSPTRPIYIDVHFQYFFRPRYNSMEWHYTLGFKIYNRPGTNDYRPPEIRKFEQGRVDGAYSENGWRSIAYGFFDDCGRYGKKWVRVENAKFSLGEDDVKDAYEALWGPLDDIQGDDGGKEMNRRKKMVNTVHVLMAAAGIRYIIAIKDDEQDDAGRVWMLEGLYDRWFARGVRKACGFQLTEDPENEKIGLQEREKEMRGNNYYDDDDDDFFAGEDD